MQAYQQLPRQAIYRTWPALVTLLFLSPILGEVFSSSTPPLVFLLPQTFFLLMLYGLGAIIIREVVHRRQLGWGNVLLLGATYGIFEEGIYVQTWLDPTIASLNQFRYYGRFLDISWVWAFGLTIFHVVVSIAVPIIIVESAFPRVATQVWLGQRGLRIAVSLFTLTSLVVFFLNGFVLHVKDGYIHPPLVGMLIAIVLVIIGLFAGLRWRFPVQKRTPSDAPRLWTLRLSALAVSGLFFLAFYGLSALTTLAYIPLIAMICVVIFSVWRCLSWSRRTGWGSQQRLALASGAWGFWMILSLTVWATGLPIVAAVFLLWVIRLEHQARPQVVSSDRS